jgi:outer membrane protein W
MRGLSHVVLIGMSALCATAESAAQIRPVPPDPAVTIRPFVDGGVDRFAASRSFNAILGKDNGPVFGGGVDVVLYSNWFVRAGAWRFKDQGERAVRLDNRTYRLGIPLTATIVPVEVSAGYRFPIARHRQLIPYVGGGFSSHRYQETSEFAEGDENVDDRFTGYQVLGGLEYRLHRFVGVAAEVQYTTVPDAIGGGGLSAEFDESDLGGLIVRARVLFGR